MNKKWKKSLGFMTSIFLLSSFSYASDENIKMGVGYYMPNDNVILPLLVTSKDYGATWAYAPDISSRSILPADFTDEDFPWSTSMNSLVSISCQKDFCMTVGRYKNDKKVYDPLIGLSKDHGVSWYYTSIKPTDYAGATGWIFDPIKTACNSSMCLVAMPYINTQNNWSYFVATTNNQGQSWAYGKFIPRLPKGDAVISGLDCTDQTCVGIGFVDSQEPNGYLKDGFITVSKDQGKTWAFPKLDMPSKLQKFALEDVKCKGNICIAKGVGFDANITPYLVLLRSENGGDSWEFISNDYHVVFNNQAGNGAISSTDETWAIAGTSYVKKTDYNETHPFVLISQDEGKTWIQPSDIIAKLPEELARTNFTSGELINCSGDNCIFSTITTLRNTMTPAVAISHDKGLTWNYVNISPADLGYFGASVYQISCDGKSYIAMGHYNTKQKIPKPFLITSNDNGKTWYLPSLNIPEYVDAGFFGNSNSTAYAKKHYGIKAELEQLLKQRNER